jgi:hypothetical protein
LPGKFGSRWSRSRRRRARHRNRRVLRMQVSRLNLVTVRFSANELIMLQRGIA